MAQDPGRPWIKTTVRIYGRKVKVYCQSIDALWYPSAGPRLLRIVVVRDPRGHRRDVVSSPPTSRCGRRRSSKPSPPCAGPLEVCFRDVKQFLGLEDPQNRVSPRHSANCSPGLLYL